MARAPHRRFTLPRRAPVRAIAAMLVAGLLAAATPPADSISAAATSSTVVSVLVPSATNVAIDAVGAPPNGCQAGTADVTRFGTVMPGSSVITTRDCNVVWGSSNDSAMLRLYQRDGLGYAMHPDPDAGTMASYHLDGTWTDTSATANPLTAASSPNDPAFVVGRSGFLQGLELDGNDEATAPHNAAYTTLDTFTVDAWIRIDALTAGVNTENYVVSKASSSTSRNFALGVRNVDGTPGGRARITADLSASGVNLPDPTGTTDLNDGDWHHIAMVVDSTPTDPSKTYRLYADGVLEASMTFSGNVDNSGAPLRLGRDHASINTFDGIVSDLRVRPRAVSIAELQAYVADTAGPPDFDDDNIGPDNNWTEGSGMFGVCLETASNGASGGAGVGGWNVSGNDNCTTGAQWNAVAAKPGDPGEKVAAVTPGPDADAAVTLRFGMRAPATQAPGEYVAPLVFEVVAPYTP
jgi:hypothetical protein